MIAAAAHSGFEEFAVGIAVALLAPLVIYGLKVLRTVSKNFSQMMVAVVGKPADKFGPGQDGLVKTVAEHGDTLVKQAYAMAEQDTKLDTLLLSAKVLVDDSKTNGGLSSRDVLNRIEAIVTDDKGEVKQ